MQFVRIFPWRLLCAAATATETAATSTLTTSATGECRYQVLSAALGFTFFPLFGTTHFNDESSGVAGPGLSSPNSDSTCLHFLRLSARNKENANLCVSLSMLSLGLALNTSMYWVSVLKRGVYFLASEILQSADFMAHF